MIIGTGIDIVEIDRFKKIKDLKGIAKKILHTNELEEFNKKANDQFIFLAKKFAFKEAFVKALGTGFSNNINFRDINIINDKKGKPIIKINNNLRKIIKQRFKIKKFKCHLSMSDEKKHSISFVILFGS